MLILIKRFIILLIALQLSGCFSNPNLAYNLRQPISKPIRNVTNMDNALMCMDNLLLKEKIPPIYLTSFGIPNRAGDKINLNSGIDMLFNAISLLSTQSNAFRYVHLSNIAPSSYTSNTNQHLNDTTLIDPSIIKIWQQYAIETPTTFSRPQWIIMGSISQVDDNVISQSRGGSISLGFGDLGGSADKISSIISLDLQLLDWNNLQLKNGSAISNSIAVMKSSSALDFGARLKSNIGAYIDVSNENNESGGQAVRTLIQFSTMQLLGKLTGINYQHCLTQDNLPSYEQLRQEVITPPPPKLTLKLDSSKGYSYPIYHPSELLSFSVTVNQEAQVHCFISDTKRRVRPVFPNLKQDGYLKAQQTITIPSAEANFNYRFDKTGFEQLICVAAKQDLQSPWQFNKDILHADYLPVEDATDIEAGYREKTRGEVLIEKLTLHVK
ncbi:MAG: DUF4384 domain-containing protein [Methylococcaceae bacterium]